MPARALLVLLVMLNLGVALWWLLKPAAPPVPPQALPADVPRLQLLEERTEPARAGTAARVDADGQAGADTDGGSAEDAGVPTDALANDRTSDRAMDPATNRAGAGGNAAEDAPR